MLVWIILSATEYGLGGVPFALQSFFNLFNHVTPLLRSLHWLPVQNRIHYKLSLLCFQVLNAIAPQYLCDLIKVYTPSRQLRSSSDTSLFKIPSTRTKTYGGRTFSYQGPAIWNTLPLSLRSQSSSDTFKTNLKTHLFPS